NSMEHVLAPLPFTIEAVCSLNNGSVNFQDAPALFNVDLSTFKAMLKQINIFAWKEVNGSLVRIHRGDYDITILIKGMRKRYVVKITDSFEDISRMLEKDLKLSPGCYKLTYKHTNRKVGKVWLKTDRDWDFAVLDAQWIGYFVRLYLEVFESIQTCGDDACDYVACDDDACFEGTCDEDLTDDDFYIEDFDEDDIVARYYVEDDFNFNDVACDENSLEHITKEAILSLNNGSVTFEQARAHFNVDLSTFKARLEQLDIFVWKEVNGSLVRIHGGDYKLSIILKGWEASCVVKATDSFEYVIRLLEEKNKLSPGCYKLTYKHPNRSIGYVWLRPIVIGTLRLRLPRMLKRKRD
ncbi:hypothetical protein Tco_1144423, partial [Tanacetum coccineum]